MKQNNSSMQDKETEKQYLSLKEATEYCDYSQEYLSLRARQGKLKAMKFGRNWVTTKDWIDEYRVAVVEYNNKQTKSSSGQKIFQPPSNLPISEALLGKNQDDYSLELLSFDSNKAKSIKPGTKIRFGLVVIFTIFSLIASIAFGQESIKNVYHQLDSFTETISQEFDEKAVETAEAAFSYIDKLVSIQIPDLVESIKPHVEAYIIRTQEQILQYYNTGAAIFFK